MARASGEAGSTPAQAAGPANSPTALPTSDCATSGSGPSASARCAIARLEATKSGGAHQFGDLHPRGDLVGCRVVGQLGSAHAHLVGDGARVAAEDGVEVVIDDAPALIGGQGGHAFQLLGVGGFGMPRLQAARRPVAEREPRDHGHFDQLAARFTYLRTFYPGRRRAPAADWQHRQSRRCRAAQRGGGPARAERRWSHGGAGRGDDRRRDVGRADPLARLPGAGSRAGSWHRVAALLGAQCAVRGAGAPAVWRLLGTGVPPLHRPDHAAHPRRDLGRAAPRPCSSPSCTPAAARTPSPARCRNTEDWSAPATYAATSPMRNSDAGSGTS